MTCRYVEADLVDRARGAALDPDRAAAVDDHLHACPRCAARFVAERDLSRGLRRLSGVSEPPPVEGERADAARAAFAAAWTASRASAPRPSPSTRRAALATAAVLAAAAVLAIAIGTRDRRPAMSPAGVSAPPPSAFVSRAAAPPAETRITSTATAARPGPARSRRRPSVRSAASAPPPTQAVGEFVVWPGAIDLPRFESGRLLRVAMPAAVAESLGVRPVPASGIVQTDVLVGQDGYARAVRLAQGTSTDKE